MANCICPPTVEDQEYEIYKTLNTVAQNAEFFSSACWKNLSDDQKLCLVTRSFIDVVDSVGGVGPIGPQGPEGPVGEVGPEGPEGLQGAQGIVGTQGSDGDEGPSVEFRGVVANETNLPTPSTSGYCYFVQDESSYYVYDGSAWIGYGPLQGQPGPTGPQGLAGPIGATGPQGSQGATGATGPVGPTGIQGISGGFDASNIITARVGDNLITKYGQAVALKTAIGANATNRVALIIMPGNYTLSSTWNINSAFVDVIGLGSSPNSPKVIISFSSSTGINVTVSDVRIVGLSVSASTSNARAIEIPPGYTPFFQNCTTSGIDGGYFGTQTTNGTFVNCSAGQGFSRSTLGQAVDAAGTYINCKCINGFGYSTGTFGPSTFERKAFASGTFIRCSTSSSGFAGSAGGSLVGGFSSASGTFIDCIATNVFARDYFSGTAKNCRVGSASFGSSTPAPGGKITGKIIKCKTSGVFGSLGAGGQIRFSLDGSNNIVNLG
jgi:hypothetical protein